MESGLIFNQLICEFESRHPCQTFGRMPSVTTSEKCSRHVQSLSLDITHVGCSSTAERRAVNAEKTSSILASQPKLQPIRRTIDDEYMQPEEGGDNHENLTDLLLPRSLWAA